ncbi:MAG TPA: helix-turn-helix domain-containing protein [Lamprocystis sp. (in: g-proteobacteria)]|nr:helix-turn-helix domain-containing protein [Lamprocystis sp. (in: g-proteobacteria)]
METPRQTPIGNQAVRPPRAFIVVQDIDDPIVWEATSPPWEVLASPIGRGSFRNIKRILATPNWLVYWESFGSALHVQGWTPAGMLGFTAPLRLGGRSSYWRAALHEHGLPATLPGSLDVHLDAGQEQVIAFARLDWLRAQLDPLTARAIEHCAVTRVLPAVPRERRVLGTWLRRLLDRVHTDPQVLAYPAAVAALECDLLDGLLRTLCLAMPGRRLEGARRRRRGFELAIEYIRAADLGGLNAPALCAEVGVSQRTLEYAFQEQLGTSPMDFIRRLRLHATRRALLAGERGGPTVAEIAMTFGFYQLGRFATEYRTLFGELPSTTLSRHGVYTGAKPFV